MSLNPQKVRLASAILVIVGVVVSFAMHLRLLEYADDDAYIHMRVARNLWLLGEPYFNRGESVMASTSPLWVLLTSPFTVAGASQNVVVCVVNAFILVALAAVWSGIYSGLFSSSSSVERLTAACIVFFTAAPASVGLMETPCALLLAGVGLLGVLRGQWWGIPSSIAAVFVRPECVVFCVVTVALKVVRGPRFRMGESLGGCILMVAMVSWQLLNFGSLYPHTAYVKDVVYDLTGRDFIRLAFIAGYGDWAVRNLMVYLVGAMVLVTLWVIARFKLPTATLSLAAAIRQREALWVLIVPSIAIVAAYSVKRVLIFPWYAPLVLVTAHLAILRMLCVGGVRVRALALLLLAPLAIVACQLSAAVFVHAYAPFFEAGARARNLRRVGRTLASEFPQATIMAPEIGALGFEFPGKIIDAIGLASPEALSFHPLRVPDQRPTGFHGGVPAALVEREKPTIVVGLDSFLLDFFRSPVSAEYDIRKQAPVAPEDIAALPSGRVLGATALTVAVRRGDEPAAAQER